MDLDASQQRGRRVRLLIIVIVLVLGALLVGGAFIARNYLLTRSQNAGSKFSGERAYADVKYQMDLGSRVPGTPGHDQIVAWLKRELEKAGWQVEIQETTQMGHPIQNVIAKRGQGRPWILLGAHYDTRMVADQDADPVKARQYVPGADDGASGVAVLLELARVLPADLRGQVWLAFFDAEDNGDIPGWDWSLGAQAVASSLTEEPDAVVVVDMVGDKDLNIYKEKNSNPQIMESIWNTALKLGFAQFNPKARWSMLDDHTPFLQAGIPAVDIIDFDYPYYHTSQDTLDKVSASSLEAVGETLRVWLIDNPFPY